MKKERDIILLVIEKSGLGGRTGTPALPTPCNRAKRPQLVRQDENTHPILPRRLVRASSTAPRLAACSWLKKQAYWICCAGVVKWQTQRT